MFKSVSKKILAAHRLNSKKCKLQRINSLQEKASVATTISTSSNIIANTASEQALRSKHLKIHTVEVLHDSTGIYIYQVELSCDDSDSTTVECKWKIRFTKSEFDRVFVPNIAFKIQNKVAHWMKASLKERVKVPRGSSTYLAAMKDRHGRTVKKVIRYITYVILATLFSYLFKQFYRTIINEEWSDARLWFITMVVLLLSSLMYGLFDYFVLQMFPSNTLLKYHRANVSKIKNTLETAFSSKDFYKKIYTDERMAGFLQFSPQALRRRFSLAHREGYVKVRVVGRTEYEADNGISLEGGCCRCTIEFGLRSSKSWHRRWAVLRSTGISFFRHPFDKSPTHMILFDTQFYVSKSKNVSKGVAVSPSLIVAGSNAVCEIATPFVHDRDDWYSAIGFATNMSTSLWTKEHRFGSYAPKRMPSNTTAGIQKDQCPATSPKARWFLNGKGYYAKLTESFEQAKSEVG
tara:strand:- start:2439 stop:3827 length:1389 start_codon:yes stop_codon:yes gene_type:complete